nr:GNAT family protein [uncultured Actinoplanes sp.]
MLVAAGSALIAAVRPWFEHPGVQRWLGGPSWLDRPPEPPGEFRGRWVLRAHAWVYLDKSGSPAAYLGGEVYDRWCRYRPDHPIDRVEPGPAFGFAYAVDPARWGRGLGRGALRAMVDAPEVADVRVFAAGIEPENVASTRCVAAAGFAPDDPAPDWEGIVHWLLRRPV